MLSAAGLRLRQAQSHLLPALSASSLPAASSLTASCAATQCTGPRSSALATASLLLTQTTTTSTSPLFQLKKRSFHSTAAPLRAAGGFEDEPAGSDADDDEDGRANGGSEAALRRGERVGRPFLDPRAPRRQESIRADPRHKGWGGLIDILEHAAYCDGQREEDPDGFFFDQTRPEYDSDCDGDPFSNGYLTEDELEFPEEYEPDPYVPKRVVDQLYFLYTVRKYSLKQLCVKYRLSSERVSAIIALKQTEPEMIATQRYDPQVDELLVAIYGESNINSGQPAAGAAGAAPAGRSVDNWQPDYDIGVNYSILKDDQLPDDVTPVVRQSGAVLRQGHTLPRITPPPRAERKHASKFVFRDISGRRDNKLAGHSQQGSGRSMIISDFDGTVRPASNMEALYRSWETRYWSTELSKGKNGLPFAEEEAHEPASFKLPP